MLPSLFSSDPISRLGKFNRQEWLSPNFDYFDLNEWKEKAASLYPEQREQAYQRTLNNIEYYKSKATPGVCYVIVTHGFHVDESCIEKTGRWCNYCAVTALEFSQEGTKGLLNAFEGHL